MVHFGHSTCSVNIPSMDQPIKLTSFLVKLHKLLICKVFVVWAVSGGNHFDALFKFVFGKVWLQALKTIQIERVSYVFGINFYHIFMPF